MFAEEIAETATELLTTKHGAGDGVRHTILSPTRGTKEFWTNYVPTRLPDKRVTGTSQLTAWFHAQPDPAEAVALMADVAVAGWNEKHSDAAKPMSEWSEQQIFDFCLTVAARYAKGTRGEQEFAHHLAASGFEMAGTNAADERNGIDLRAETGETWQVKTVKAFGNGNFSDDCEADFKVEVKLKEDGTLKNFEEA